MVKMISMRKSDKICLRQSILFCFFITFIWLLFLGIKNKVAFMQTISPERSWSNDVCGYPLKMEISEPHGCFLKSLADKDRPAEGVRDYRACNFLAENFVPASCNIEKETHLAVRNVIRPQDVVLEIGARYGTTSCEVWEVNRQKTIEILKGFQRDIKSFLEEYIHSLHSHNYQGGLGPEQLRKPHQCGA